MKVCDRCGREYEGFDSTCDPCTFPVNILPTGITLECPKAIGNNKEGVGIIRFIPYQEFHEGRVSVEERSRASQQAGRKVARELFNTLSGNAIESVLLGLVDEYRNHYNDPANGDVINWKAWDNLADDVMKLTGASRVHLDG